MNFNRLLFTKAQQEKSDKLKKLLVPSSPSDKTRNEPLSMAEINKLFTTKGGLYKMQTNK